MSTVVKTRKSSTYVFEPYEYKTDWVPVEEIQVPPYQHPPYPNVIKQLLDDFDRKGYGFICVNQRTDGTYGVIDGQTRLEVHRVLGIPSIKAEIFVGLTMAEEARMYLYRSRNASRGPADQFTARIISGDQVALTVQAVLAKFDLTMARFGQKAVAEVHTIHCAKRLDTIVRKDPTGQRLEGTLWMIFQIWNYSPMAVSATMIDVIDTLLELFDGDPNFHDGTLIQKLGNDKFSVAYLRSWALQLQSSKPQLSLRMAMLERILEVYNYGRPEKSRLKLP